MNKIRVTVWNEFVDEKRYAHIGSIYPNGIHEAIAGFLREDDRFEVKAVSLDMPDCGLPDELLENTDVLIWWGHIAHNEVPDELVDKICGRVLQGMGFIPLHSGIFSKPFYKLIGPRQGGKYREVGENERIWVVSPAHPICEGLGAYIDIEHSEMYGEPSGLAAPDELLFISWYAGGEVMRSGGTYSRGRGRIFYLSTGHEEYPIYDHPLIQLIIKNAAAWAYNPTTAVYDTGETKPLEKLDPDRLLIFKK